MCMKSGRKCKIRIQQVSAGKGTEWLGVGGTLSGRENLTKDTLMYCWPLSMNDPFYTHNLMIATITAQHKILRRKAEAHG